MNVKIITREEWKAKPPKVKPTHHIPNKITIHHQGAKNPNLKVQPLFKGSETIKSIQALHMNVRSWSDIGYSAIIAPNGDIYQGRYFDTVGAHVKNNNTGNIGIMLIGNFEVENPTDEQIKSLKNLIVYLSTQYPSINLPKCIFGHKDFMNTDCPGKNLYPIVHDMKIGKLSLFEKEK